VFLYNNGEKCFVSQLPTLLTQVPQKIFNPYRLLILISLKSEEEIRFHKLKHSLSVTDGKLANHLKALEEEGFIKIDSFIDGKRHKTFISITPKGLGVLKGFIDVMEYLLKVLPKD
jgi:DNA-binding HxlR family transcriptional regulator